MNRLWSYLGAFPELRALLILILVIFAFDSGLLIGHAVTGA